MVDDEKAKFTPPLISFVPMFKTYSRYCTDAPESYSEVIACQLLGHALGYDAIHLIQPKPIHHNCYLILIGESTLARKTTAQEFGEEIYPYKYWLPKQASPERYVTELSENPRRMWFEGEFSYELKLIHSGGYMSHLVEITNDLHGCPPIYERKLVKKKGEESEFVIKKPYLSINSTITPEMLKKYIDEEMFTGGYLARRLLVHGENPHPRLRGKLHPDTLRLKESLRNDLNQIIRMSEEGVVFEYTDDALKRFNEIEVEAYKNESIRAFAGRYLNYVVSFSDILLVSDVIGAVEDRGESLDTINNLTQLTHLSYLSHLTIEERDNISKYVNSVNSVILVPKMYVDRAWNIIKPCLEYAGNLCQYVLFEKPIAKMRDCLLKNSPLTHSYIMQRAHLDKKQMVDARNTLDDMKFLFFFFRLVEGRRTRIKEAIYCLVENVNSEKCKTCKYLALCPEMNDEEEPKKDYLSFSKKADCTKEIWRDSEGKRILPPGSVEDHEHDTSLEDLFKKKPANDKEGKKEKS